MKKNKNTADSSMGWINKSWKRKKKRKCYICNIYSSGRELFAQEKAAVWSRASHLSSLRSKLPLPWSETHPWPESRGCFWDEIFPFPVLQPLNQDKLQSFRFGCAFGRAILPESQKPLWFQLELQHETKSSLAEYLLNLWIQGEMSTSLSS